MQKYLMSMYRAVNRTAAATEIAADQEAVSEENRQNPVQRFLAKFATILPRLFRVYRRVGLLLGTTPA